ncbi:CBS domain-containing protein [Candidatus Woesearchaeota archaeon]|nr:CBS domain-containing protein [Candidatus Woesearchaeota archaeon]
MAKIRKIMLVDVPTLKKHGKMEDAAKMLAQSDAGCVVIIENNAPVGIVTELDLIRKISSKDSRMNGPVSAIMTSPVITMSPDTKLDEALKIIDTKGFRKYPVVENNQLVGMATKRDIVNAISDNLRLHRSIQNIVLIAFVLFEFFVFVLYKQVYKYLPFGI